MRPLARELLAMTQEEFSRAFSWPRMKRAKLRSLERTAAEVLGDVGAADDVELLAPIECEEPDELVGEHAAWALGRLADHDAQR